MVAGGSGSVLDFNFKLGKTYTATEGKKHGYSRARCPDGEFNVKANALFKNEAQDPGVAATTSLKGPIAVPCTPKG